MMMNMTSEKLIEARQTLGLNITEMADALSTPRGTYLKWERGERRVPGIAEVAINCMKKKRKGKRSL